MPDSIAPIPEGYKKCSKCGEVKPATSSYFGRNRKYLRSACKDCARAASRARYESNKEKYRDNTRKYRERVKSDPEKYEAYKERDRQAHQKAYWQDPEQFRERNRRQRATYPERYREYDRRKRIKQRDRDPEAFRDRQRLGVRNARAKRPEYYRSKERVANMTPEQIQRKRAREKEWRKANPHKVAAKAHKRRARLANTNGAHTPEDILVIYESQKGLCWWCGKPVGDTYHIDHRVPLSRGGSNNPENLVISCPFCNDSKGAQFPHEWNGRLL